MGWGSNCPKRGERPSYFFYQFFLYVFDLADLALDKALCRRCRRECVCRVGCVSAHSYLPFEWLHFYFRASRFMYVFRLICVVGAHEMVKASH